MYIINLTSFKLSDIFGEKVFGLAWKVGSVAMTASWRTSMRGEGFYSFAEFSGIIQNLVTGFGGGIGVTIVGMYLDDRK